MAFYTDFSSLLAAATVVTGLIWAIDSLFFKRKREQAGERPLPKLVEYSKSFFPILLVVCVLRSFVAEPFRIPSGSMKPTLLEGDFILVNKYIYGLKLPILGTKFIKVDKPQRGDIIVFRFPHDTSIDFIKRVVGLPGDKISYQNKVLSINGQPLKQTYVGSVNEPMGAGHYIVKQYTEALPEKAHAIYLQPSREREDKEEVTVPEGHYFVMGDNRDNSEDSRAWGFVPEALILGKAIFVWMSWDGYDRDIRWSRIGHAINN